MAEAGEDEQWSDWEEEEGVAFQGLLSQQTYASVKELLESEKRGFGFDLAAEIATKGLDEIAVIKLINFIRGQRQRNVEAQDLINSIKSFLENKDYEGRDELMRPVLEEDALLMAVDDVLEAAGLLEPDADDGDDDDGEAQRGAQESKMSCDPQQDAEDSAKLEALLQRMQQTAEAAQQDQVPNAGNFKGTDDSYYFESYSKVDIHYTMLRDTVRTGAYEHGILDNAELFKDKVVLDVGCGTGILCMFAAKAGAKKVIGVDMSSIIHHARNIVAANGFGDVITLLHGRLEDLQLPVEKVDIIISEWMGYALLFESMLSSVLYARDRYLAPEGRVLPDQSRMYIEAGSPTDEHDPLKFWENVHGFNMTQLQHLMVPHAEVAVVSEAEICSDRCLFATIDAETITDEQLDFEASFVLHPHRDTSLASFVISFDVGFERGMVTPVIFSTGVQSTPTHWKQTTLWIALDKRSQLTTSQQVVGSVQMQRTAANKRDYTISVTWSIRDLQATDARSAEKVYFQSWDLLA